MHTRQVCCTSYSKQCCKHDNRIIGWCWSKNKNRDKLDLNFGVPTGFEPATYCLEGNCSIRLSHGHLTVFMEFDANVIQFLCNILCSKYVTFYINLRTFQSICIRFYTELIFAHIRTNSAFMHSNPNLSIKITDD